MLRRLLIGLVGAAIVLAVTGFAAFQLSPWPAAVVIRYFFDRGGDAAAAALQKHVPEKSLVSPADQLPRPRARRPSPTCTRRAIFGRRHAPLGG